MIFSKQNLCANYKYDHVCLCTYLDVHMYLSIWSYLYHLIIVLHTSWSESDLPLHLLRCLRYSIRCHLKCHHCFLMWCDPRVIGVFFTRTCLFKNTQLFYNVWQCVAKKASYTVRLRECLLFNLRKNILMETPRKKPKRGSKAPQGSPSFLSFFLLWKQPPGYARTAPRQVTGR